MKLNVPAVLAALLLLASSSGSRDSDAGSEWRSYGSDPAGLRFSPLKQVHAGNISRLRRAWTYHTGERQEGRIIAFESTPLAINGRLYLSTPGQSVVALDGETGEQIWKFDTEAEAARRKFQAHRGVAYWENGAEHRILFGTARGKLIALDAATGKPCANFGEGGQVDLRRGVADEWPTAEYAVTSPPAIYRDLVIVGASVPEGPSRGPSGAVRAFEVRTGRPVWRFDTIPRPGQPGHETWDGDSWKDRTGVNCWSIMSVDAERGLVFIPLGSPAYDFYGGDRKGQNLYGNSLLALEAATGRLRWHFQMVHHDIWDYDVPAQPTLVTVRREGRVIPAVAQVTKMGLVFVLDRLTGRPLFPVEERPAPRSTIPGEETSPTQPFPLKPPPLARTGMSRQEITRITPELNRYCTALFDQLVAGSLYTPWGHDLTLVWPGTLGGATWSGGSFDPVSGYYYVNVNETGAVGRMEPDPARPGLYRRMSPWGAYARFWDAKQIPCVQPPWGTLNAINLNTGEIVWKVPLGFIDELEAKGIKNTGTSSLGGSIVTAAGLVFIAGTNDSRFRAFDSRTGRELWVTRLEASGHATPMTYLGKRSGKQFVVIAAGGGGYFQQPGADLLAAYALPD